MDTRQLALLERGPLVDPYASWATACLRAAERVRDSDSVNTAKAYRIARNAWLRHCVQHGVQAVPIDAAELVRYLEWLSERLAPNSVRLHLAALCTLDQAARTTPSDREPTSIRQSVVVKRWYKAWARAHPLAPRRQAPTLAPSELERIIDAASSRPRHGSAAAHVALSTRDRAMVLVGLLGGLRSAELAALDVDDVQQHARGLRLHVRVSKNNQEGRPDYRGIIPQGRIALCGVDAWLRWLAVRGTQSGPAFPGVERDGTITSSALTPDAIADRFKVLGRRAGVAFTTHSLRATLATRSAQKKKRADQAMKQGGWRSVAVYQGYVRQGELFDEDENVTAGLLDD